MLRAVPKLLNHRRPIVVVIKICLILAAFLGAYLLRFDLTIPSIYWTTILKLAIPLLVIKLLVFRYMGLSTGWWRYVSLADALTLFKANLLASAVFILYVTFIHRLEGVPRSVLILDGVLCFLFSCGVRLLTRAYREDYLTISGHKNRGKKQILVIGAGNAGQAIVREMRLNQELNMLAIGYLDDDPSKLKQSFQGVTVLGGTDQLTEICETRRVDEVIIAIPSASGNVIKEIVALSQAAGIKFKTLPGVGCLIDGKVSVQQIRDVDMEDLLGREAARLDLAQIREYLGGKRIMVTGGGGSIGSELCRQLARFKPAQLILFEHAETPLFHS